MSSNPLSMNWNQIQTRLNTLGNKSDMTSAESDEIGLLFDRQRELEKLGQCRCNDCQKAAHGVKCKCGGSYNLDSRLTGPKGNKEYKYVCSSCKQKRGRFEGGDSDSESESESDFESDSESEDEDPGSEDSYTDGEEEEEESSDSEFSDEEEEE
jgi:hypothetical protein